MEHLMDAIDRRLTELNLPPISGTVNNRKLSIQYINRILADHGNKVSLPFQETLSRYDFRVKHVLFSFGLGIVLAPFCDLEQRIRSVCPSSFLQTWLTVCLYHDFGYFIAPDYRSASTLDALELEHPIFGDHYCESRYSRQLYEAYYQERYQQHSTGGEEVGDHGILGGCVLYERLWRAASGGTDRLPFYQDVCWRIMEHNIWKQEGRRSSPLSEIDADHFRPIGPGEPLLCLLSLVDTIEMTKRFCTYTDGSDEQERHVYPKTLGRKVKMEVTGTAILLEYAELEQFIRSNKYFDSLDVWRKAVLGLQNWVDVKATPWDGSGVVLTPLPAAADPNRSPAQRVAVGRRGKGAGG